MGEEEGIILNWVIPFLLPKLFLIKYLKICLTKTLNLIW